MNLSEEQILALAPDESSKKSGKELANPAKWVSAGANEQALWGECQGSGSKPYQTQIDINNLAFKCSCPSRKFPCKHGLGLMLLYTRNKNFFKTTDAPAWVNDWISKRAEKQEKQAEKKDKPVDEVAQAKRQQARQLKVSDGVDELLLWIKDIVRNGILNVPEKTGAWFENMIRRMVDAQAPGLANMVKYLSAINFYKDGWQSELMDQLVRIYLVIAGFKNIDSLPEELQQDIRSWIGFTQNQEELKERTGVTDIWLVLGKQTNEEDTITVERNWMYGIRSNQYGLVLQFFVKGQGGQHILTPGMFVEAELVFYPSALPMRAIIKRQMAASALEQYAGFANWQQVTEAETLAGSAVPFHSERPYIIEKVRPVLYEQQWWLQDSASRLMRIRQDFKNIWKLLSLSGGQPLDVAVIGKEKTFEPVGAWYQNQYKLL